MSKAEDGNEVVGKRERFGFVKSAMVEQEHVAACRESLCQLVDKNLKGVCIQVGQLQKEAFSCGGFNRTIELKAFKAISGAESWVERPGQ